MKKIETVAIVGLGALGTLFGNLLSKRMERKNLRIIADAGRIERYKRDQVFSNGDACAFHYVTPQEKTSPADLILIAVKSLQLKEAIASVQNQVGPDTLILSLLNGISSEAMIADAYGTDKVIYCVAQGMDAVKEGNRLTYTRMGKLCIGPKAGAPIPEKVQRVVDFFDSVGFPYEVDTHMLKRMWGKFMLNVGVNQTVAVFGPDYAAVFQEGRQRETMIAAMREVMELSKLEGIDLCEEDIAYWLRILGTLSPKGKPSMRQDVEARRYSEVGLFSGTVLELAKKHGLSAPVNKMLYDSILAMEEQY